MASLHTSCIKFSGGQIHCPSCSSDRVIKNGRTANNKQQFACKNCRKRFIIDYCYKAYSSSINTNIIALIKEGSGIRSIARLLRISTITLLARINTIAGNVKQPPLTRGRTYEVDELCTFVYYKGRKIWVASALDRHTKQVVRMVIGSRTNKTLQQLTSVLQLSNARTIYTDKLKNYKHLIDARIHRTTRYGTNYLERYHLTLRTHLRRLNRRTICFSRSLLYLENILKVYLWA